MGKKLNLGHISLLKNFVFKNYLNFNLPQDLTDAQKAQAKENLDIDYQAEVTYAELKALKDNESLTPGMKYRITDFKTTIHTTTDKQSSAEHPFDLVVTAISETELSEDARALVHEGDTYFANNKLYAWVIKYCFDNDTSRFYYADPDGKGYIYYMKDEFDNSACYDFKNIMFKRVYDEDTKAWFKYDNLSSTDTSLWVYTFSCPLAADATESTDYSLLGIVGYTNYCTNNSIGKTTMNNLYGLNNVCFIGKANFNKVGNNCNGITFGDNTFNNIIGDSCGNMNIYHKSNYNIFDDNCVRIKMVFDIDDTYGCVNNHFMTGARDINMATGCDANIFEPGSNNITLKYGCDKNTFKQYCNNIILNKQSSGNIFGTDTKTITLGVGCNDNVFNAGSKNISFATSCNSNILNPHCNSIIFGENCSGNKLGSYTTYINFTGNCYYNEIGNYAGRSGDDKIQFGTDCKYNKVGDSSYRITLGNQCIGNIIESECNKISIYYNSKNNVVKKACKTITLKDSSYRNTIGSECDTITMDYSCRDNVIGEYVKTITFGNQCFGNIIRNNCNTITLARTAFYNIIDQDCYRITINNGTNQGYHKFGINCRDIVLSTGSYNTFGSYCRDIEFGDGCNYVVLGSNCKSITLGNNSGSNTFGNNCTTITLGTSCTINHFEEACSNIKLGNTATYNKFGVRANSVQAGNNFKDNIIGPESAGLFYETETGNLKDKVEHITIESSFNLRIYAPASGKLMNYVIKGIRPNGEFETMTLENDKDYITTVAKNSSGVIKYYCDADFVN